MAAAVVAFILLVGVVNVIDGDEPAAPAFSSFSTEPLGLGAWHQLLERSGRTVSRQRETVDRRRPDAGSTLVVIEPERLSDPEVRALERTVRDGTTVVLSGAPESLLGRLFDDPPVSAPGAVARPQPLAPVPEVASVRRLRGLEAAELQRLAPGSTLIFEDAGQTLPIAGGERRTSAAVASVGDGRLVLLADPVPLSNLAIDQADNAAFALAVTGSDRPVVFLESVHGFGPARGLAALPGRVWWVVAGLLLAALAFAASRARRLGPPDPDPGDAPPRRRDHIDAVALTLSRSPTAPAAAEPVRQAVRRRVSARSRHGDGDFAGRAAAAGLDEGQIAALGHPVEDEEQALAVGRALARLEGGRR
ncbi:MAG: DUF4350 domain-containing protein [Solirubrobacterales bacterium]